MPGIEPLKKIFLFKNQKDQEEKEADILHLKQALKTFINNSSHLLREYWPWEVNMIRTVILQETKVKKLTHNPTTSCT